MIKNTLNINSEEKGRLKLLKDVVMRVCLVALMFLFPLPAHAQSFEKMNRFVDRCGRGQCETAMTARLGRIDRQRSPTVRNEQFARIGLALYTVARRRDNPRVRNRVARALDRLAGVTESAEQAEIFTELAEIIRSGEIDLYETYPFPPASPS